MAEPTHLEGRYDTPNLESVVHQLRKNKSLTSLQLEHFDICGSRAAQLCDALKTCSLNVLDLAASGIDDESIAAIARVLEVNSTISELDLAENQFGLEGLKALARTLRRNHTLTKLNLNCNNKIATLEGAREVASVIAHNTSIKHMRLSELWMRDCDLSPLAEALKHNITLRSMDLEFDNYTGSEIGGSLARNGCLEELDIWNRGCTFPEVTDPELDKNRALRKNAFEAKLWLYVCHSACEGPLQVLPFELLSILSEWVFVCYMKKWNLDNISM